MVLNGQITHRFAGHADKRKSMLDIRIFPAPGPPVLFVKPVDGHQVFPGKGEIAAEHTGDFP